MVGRQLRVQHKWQKWRSLSWRDRRLFIAALCLLPLTGLLLRVTRYQTLYLTLQRYTPLREEQAPARPQLAAAGAALLVSAAARHGPFNATCLHQSLVLWWLLRRRGIAADIRLGISKQEGDFAAHAWVEYRGRVINDRQDIVASFVPLF